MNSLPRITCITITHNRVHLLKRAMEYFQYQTYLSKESIIFYTEEDEETTAFVKSNPHYKSLHLVQRNEGNDLFVIDAEDANNIFSGGITRDGIYLKNKRNQYVTALENGMISWTNNGQEATLFYADKDVDLYNFKTVDDSWLAQSIEGEWVLCRELACKGSFHVLLMADSSTKLIPSDSFGKENKLGHWGFDLQVVREADSPFVFIQLLSKEPISLGAKRNLAMECATSEYICVWDDDDWYDEKRLAYQMEFMLFTNKIACSIANTILFDYNSNKGYINGARREGWEQTLLCQKSEMSYYGNLNRSEDTPVLKELFRLNKLAVIEEPSLYIYNVHAFNTSPSAHFLSMINNHHTVPLSVLENEKVMQQLGIN